MSILSNISLHSMAIEDEPLWWPYDPSAVQPSSVDFHLSTDFIDEEDGLQICPEGYWIESKECVLASTMETVNIPLNVRGRVEGKSTWGRKFLDVHSTAGYIDAGFRGQITLELYNKSSYPIHLVPGVAICQIEFAWLDQPANPGYDGKYQRQQGVTPPR